MLIKRMSNDLYNEIIEQVKKAARPGNIGIYDEEIKGKTILIFKAHFGDNGRGKFSDYFRTLKEFFIALEAIPQVDFVYPIEYNPDPLDDVYDFTIKIQLNEDTEREFSSRSNNTFLIRF